MQKHVNKAPHFSEIKDQLQALASPNNELYFFTRTLLNSPELDGAAKEAISKIKADYVTGRIKDICAGVNTHQASGFNNPATLRSMGVSL